MGKELKLKNVTQESLLLSFLSLSKKLRVLDHKSRMLFSNYKGEFEKLNRDVIDLRSKLFK